MRFSLRYRISLSIFASLTAFTFANSAMGEVFGGSILRIEASRNDGTFAEFAVSLSEAALNPLDQTVSWSEATQTPLVDSKTGETVGTLRSATIFARQYPPRILVNFSVQAGEAETVFRVWSSLVSVPAIRVEDALGRATASFALNDLNGDGAEVSFMPGHNGIYQACNNGWPQSADVFSNLIGRIVAGPNGSGSALQNDPPTGMRPVAEDVWSGCSYSTFRLSAGDRVTAQTRFDMAGPQFPTGDLNCDGRINNLDIDPFVTALIDAEIFEIVYDCEWENADVNIDDEVNNFDVDAFVELLIH